MKTDLHEMVKKGVEAACRSRLIAESDSVVIRAAMAVMHKVLFGKTIYVVCENARQAKAFQSSLGLKVYYLANDERLYGLQDVTIVFLTGTKYSSELRTLVNIRVRNPDIWCIAEF